MHRQASRFMHMLLAIALALSASLASAQQTFSKEQIDQMMAPIALYPDSLLSQVLMAATYPADVADAAKWSKDHADQKGDAAVKAVQDQPWDPSVQSLVAFPQVIQMMGDQPDWTRNLGDAFLASSKDVLDSAQRLRKQAQSNGSLKSNEQQTVTVQQEPQTQQTVIQIAPTNPQTVYVPAYNPTVVYGAWPYPAYPPYYYPPYPAYYPGAALASGIAFGVGVAATAALWGSFDWGRGDVDINVNRYNSINSNRQISANQNRFQHNSANRRDVPYRDQRSQERFGNRDGGNRGAGDAGNRADFRGHDNRARDTQRQQAEGALRQRGMDPGQERDRLRNDAGTRERAQQAAQRGGGIDRGGAGDRAGAGNRAGAGDRAAAGGLDRGGAAGNRAAGGNLERGGGAHQVQHRSGDNALRGAGHGASERQSFERGNASRQAMGNRGGGGGAHAGGFSGGGGGARAGGGGGFHGGGGGGGGFHGGGGGRRR